MIKIPNSLIIGGIKWQIILDKKTKGGGFYWHSHKIKIDKSYDLQRRFQVLIHEVCEVIIVNNCMRYQKPIPEAHNGDYLFSFNHTEFEIFTDELSGIIKQIFNE